MLDKKSKLDDKRMSIIDLSMNKARCLNGHIRNKYGQWPPDDSSPLSDQLHAI